MINANKENLKLLRERKRLKEIQGNYKYSLQTPIKIKPIQEDKFHHFLSRMERQKRGDKQRMVLIIGLTLVIMLLLLLWIVSADYSSLIDVIQ